MDEIPLEKVKSFAPIVVYDEGTNEVISEHESTPDAVRALAGIASYPTNNHRYSGKAEVHGLNTSRDSYELPSPQGGAWSRVAKLVMNDRGTKTPPYPCCLGGNRSEAPLRVERLFRYLAAPWPLLLGVQGEIPSG